MNVTTSTTKCALALALAAMLASAPALADKDKGKGNHGNSGRGDANESSSRDNGRRDHFEDRHHVIVRDYYSEQHSSGRCPPGLAKKHNGCRPPGQAKHWSVGQPLPRNVVYYSVPQQLVVQFGQPPAGYRYVRVASDILLIAIGTRMIVDSIQDLGRS